MESKDIQKRYKRKKRYKIKCLIRQFIFMWENKGRKGERQNYQPFLRSKVDHVTIYRSTFMTPTFSRVIRMQFEIIQFALNCLYCDLLLCMSRCLCKENGVRNKALHSSHWNGLSSECVCRWKKLSQEGLESSSHDNNWNLYSWCGRGRGR